MTAVASLSQRLGAFAHDLKFEELPENVVDRLKALLLHNFANALVGAQYPTAASTIRFVRREESATERGGCTVLVDGGRATRMGAAYANSMLMHVSGQSDSYKLFVHPGLTVIPAALATAQTQASDGRVMLASIAAGYEVLVRIASVALPSTQASGFRSGAVYGGVGAAVATAKLLGASADEITDAIAHWVSVAAGNLEGARSGGHETVLHEPTAARNGILAALQAREGFRGGRTVLEGDAGFYRAYAGIRVGRRGDGSDGPATADLELVCDGLGEQFELLEVIQKAYSTGGYNQPLVDVAAKLATTGQLRPGDVDRVEIHMNWLATRYPSPEFTAAPPTARRKSSHYFCAWGLTLGAYPRLGRPIGHMVGLDDEDQPDPPEVMDLMRRVEIVPSTELGPMSPRIVVHTVHGTLEAAATGTEFQWSLEETVRRTGELVPGMAVGVGQFDELSGWIADIDSQPTVEPLLDLTVPAS